MHAYDNNRVLISWLSWITRTHQINTTQHYTNKQEEHFLYNHVTYKERGTQSFVIGQLVATTVHVKAHYILEAAWAENFLSLNLYLKLAVLWFVTDNDITCCHLDTSL